jgi:hypothetical protein
MTTDSNGDGAPAGKQRFAAVAGRDDGGRSGGQLGKYLSY